MITRPSYLDVFSRRLKQALQAKGLSQKQWGIAAGIDEFVASTRINRYEKGVHEANIQIAQHLATVLELPLAYLYTEDDELAELMLIFLVLAKPRRGEVMQCARRLRAK
ncbi:XRE family transcriptional regulator [Sodalis-like symbiont of Bactericera trigonica]|nr:XRE family transcriptional regulator [Sodalis-like symbiont of Bactericera trigonica]